MTFAADGAGFQVGTVNTITVGTAAVQVAIVPVGRTLTFQNLGAHSVWLQLGYPAVSGKGIEVKGGTPGGTFSTAYPGADEVQRWYAVSSTGTVSCSVLVM